MEDSGIFDTKASWLAQLIGLDEGDQGLWTPDELAAMLDHQFSARLEFDLGYLGRKAAPALDAMRTAEGPPIRSFRDLLHHPRPPVELLESTKEFARACGSGRDHLLPDEIAAMLYILSIAVARAKCRRRISKLDDHALRHSLDWACKQSWVDEPTRQVLCETLQVIGSGEPESDA